MKASLARRVTAEFVGTLFLVAAVVGSGIMGERLAGGNVAIALLANTIATGAALVALICAFGDISGAHLNPVVSLAEALNGRLSRARGYRLCGRANFRRNSWRARCTRDVSAPADFAFASRAKRRRAIPQRIHRHIRVALRDRRMLAGPSHRRPIRRGSLHHRRLLVYVIHVVRESRRHHRKIAQRYLFRDSSR